MKDPVIVEIQMYGDFDVIQTVAIFIGEVEPQINSHLLEETVGCKIRLGEYREDEYSMCSVVYNGSQRNDQKTLNEITRQLKEQGFVRAKVSQIRICD